MRSMECAGAEEKTEEEKNKKRIRVSGVNSLYKKKKGLGWKEKGNLWQRRRKERPQKLISALGIDV